MFRKRERRVGCVGRRGNPPYDGWRLDMERAVYRYESPVFRGAFRHDHRGMGGRPRDDPAHTGWRKALAEG